MDIEAAACVHNLQYSSVQSVQYYARVGVTVDISHHIHRDCVTVGYRSRVRRVICPKWSYADYEI